MKNNCPSGFPASTFPFSTLAATHSEQPAPARLLPVWRASFRMAVVAAAGLAAAALMATGITGCADMSGIAPQASLRDASSLGLTTLPGTPAGAGVSAEWWRDFGDGPSPGHFWNAQRD